MRTITVLYPEEMTEVKITADSETKCLASLMNRLSAEEKFQLSISPL